MPSKLYCPNKQCAVMSYSGGFTSGRRYKCQECGTQLSEKPSAKHGGTEHWRGRKHRKGGSR